jgi:light-regulated signal transduction histidine kinase (bacteriophytochrome)
MDGFARILWEGHAARLDQEGMRLLNVISQNAQEMSRLIDDLLAFSRLSRLELKAVKIDMARMVSDVFNEYAPAEEKNITSFDVQSIPDAAGDPAMIRQVWRNLIDNALKFSSSRKSRIITIGSRIEGAEIVYFIKDNGVGFDMEYAHKLFGVFQRLHSKSEFEGTGAGLAIVQRIVHRHHGRVWAESIKDDGATFYFSLPRP